MSANAEVKDATLDGQSPLFRDGEPRHPALSGTGLAVHEDLAMTERAASADPMMALIARAAADPNTNIDKLERLLAMQREARAYSAKIEYFAAMSEMQDELPSINENGEIKINESKPGQKYALWEDINKAIKPVLKAHGFALFFRTGQSDAKITVTGILSHRGGHSEETTMQFPPDASGSKNAVQAIGSSTSYGKRYTAMALLNLTSGGEDDDGRSGGSAGTIDDDQVEKIFDLIKRTKADTAKFCKHFAIDAVPDLPKASFDTAISMLNTKARAITPETAK